MKFRTHLFLLLSLFLCLPAEAQESKLPKARRKAAYGNGFYVSPTAYDYTPIAKEATKEAKTEYEKARDLFLWVCRNINYDTQTNIRTADECWEQRRAVCQGYCELYYRMAEAINLDVDMVYGKSRNASGHMEEHGWLSIKTEKGNVLADPTWGAGTVMNGEFRHLSTPLLWFDVNPQWFIFTHYPNNKRYQYLRTRLSERDFDQLHYTTPLLEAWGITPEEALRQALDEGRIFPTANTMNASFLKKISICEAPLDLNLTCGETYTFCIEKVDADCAISILCGQDEYKEKAWQKEGNRLKLEIIPKQEGRLALTVTNTNGFVHLTQKVAEYMVKRNL